MSSGKGGDVAARWEAIQKKTFTGWCNIQLAKVGLKIEDLFTDFSDGLKLIKLLEVISAESFPFKYDRNPKMRVQMCGNVGKALEFLQKHLKLVGIGPEDVVDHKSTLILGLIWTIILRFSIADISMEDMSAREGLLLWCQRKTAGYKGVNVQNFHFSFQDGKAFCALIHKHRPDLLNYDDVPNDKKEALNLAFEVAERDLGIPKLLDADDVVDMPKPDEKSIMTYVAQYFHCFSKGNEAENAARRVGKLLAFTAENDRAKADYVARADDLIAWINAKIVELDDRNFANDLDGLEAQVTQFTDDYKKGEKPPRQKEKVDLEIAFNALQTRLSLNNRPPFVAPEGHSPDDISALWNALEEHERERKKALAAELERQRAIASLLRRFNLFLDRIEAWASNRVRFFDSAAIGTTIAECNAQLKNHALFEDERSFMQKRLDSAQQIFDELTALQYHAVDGLRERLNALRDDLFAKVDSAGASRKARLEAELERLLSIETQLLEFSRQAKLLFVYLDNEAEEVLAFPISVFSVDAIAELQRQFDACVADFESRRDALDHVHSLADSLRNLGENPSRLSEITLEEVDAKWHSIEQLVVSRREALAAETARQAHHEELRVKFAEEARALVAHCDAVSAEVTGANGSGEQILAQIAQAMEKHAAANALLNAATQTQGELDAQHVRENAHTEQTVETLAALVAQVAHIAKEKRENVAREMGAKEGSSLSQDQLSEFQSAFAHFDKNKSNSLDRLEFGACLKALGQDVQLDEKDADSPTHVDKILAKIERSPDGSVSFQAFVQYMERISKDVDSPDQVTESFKVLAGGKDFITEADLRTSLPADQVTTLMSTMPPHPSGNGFDYVTYVRDSYAR